MTPFSSRWVEPPAHVAERPGGGLAAGFRAARRRRRDQAVGRPRPRAARLLGAGRRQRGALHPLRRARRARLLCRERCRLDALRAVVANSGNANAATGNRGLEDAARMQGAGAMASGVREDQVAVASTGVIGVPLPMDGVTKGILAARGELAPDGDRAFWRAIATTDAFEKLLSLDVALPSGTVRLSAQAKGAGMIQPGFATMLCFVADRRRARRPRRPSCCSASASSARSTASRSTGSSRPTTRRS